MADINDDQTNPTAPDLCPVESAPAKYVDPVIEVYMKDVDVTLLRENLKLTVEERIRKAESFHSSIEGWRGAGKRKQ